MPFSAVSPVGSRVGTGSVVEKFVPDQSIVTIELDDRVRPSDFSVMEFQITEQ